MVQFPGSRFIKLCIHFYDMHHYKVHGLPHSGIPGSMDVCSSPRLFAACHALHRRTAPRHPPWTLIRLTILFLYPFPKRSNFKCDPVNYRYDDSQRRKSYSVIYSGDHKNWTARQNHLTEQELILFRINPLRKATGVNRFGNSPVRPTELDRSSCY